LHQISVSEDDVWLAELIDHYDVDELPAVFAIFTVRKLQTMEIGERLLGIVCLESFA
jgi:hypothetical protein